MKPRNLRSARVLTGYFVRLRTALTRRAVRLWPLAAWLIIWQISGVIFHQPLLLPLPSAVLRRLMDFMMTGAFWKASLFSSVRILYGFFLGCLTGILLSIPASISRRIRDFLYPAVLAIKSIPVASFVILALIWLNSRTLAIFIAFLMAFPPVYLSVLNAIQETDVKLLEMAEIFRVSIWRKITGIYIPRVLPAFRTAVSVSMGLCWKAGTAAEVIGLPRGSLGEQLYNSKIYFLTPDLFAWTIIIIILSAIWERLFLYILDKIIKKTGIL